MSSPVAETLKNLRRRARLSQKELAGLSGVSDAAIGLIERGKSHPQPDTLRLLSKGLATDVDGNLDSDRAEDLAEELMLAAGYLHPRSSGRELKPEDRVNDALARHPNIRISLAQAGPDLDDDDAEMIVGFIDMLARRKVTQRRGRQGS
jgi:transcriptional regulator with XRE-family HTH domain